MKSLNKNTDYGSTYQFWSNVRVGYNGKPRKPRLSKTMKDLRTSMNMAVSNYTDGPIQYSPLVLDQQYTTAIERAIGSSEIVGFYQLTPYERLYTELEAWHLHMDGHLNVDGDVPTLTVDCQCLNLEDTSVIVID